MQSLSATLDAGRLQAGPVRTQPISPNVQYVRLRCPVCLTAFASVTYHALGQHHDAIMCNDCCCVMAQQNGIWLGLTKQRQLYFQRFIREYELVRKAEGRGSDRFEFYLSLPFRDQTRRNSWQWKIRARTYRYIERRILRALAADSGRSRYPLSILDLGAGNGWLSYRLANLGHRPIAVDLQTNSFDGLGAAVHYRHALPMLFPRFQAELDRLPFETGQFDCAIFNASFHYSENYDTTLAEAIRCLRPGGSVIIADTPSYTCEASGQRMLAERHSHFQQRFGFASDGLASCEYLTRERLLGLEARHDVVWTTHRVWYGFRWACRPLLATLRGSREPSQFRIYTAQVKTA